LKIARSLFQLLPDFVIWFDGKNSAAALILNCLERSGVTEVADGFAARKNANNGRALVSRCAKRWEMGDGRSGAHAKGKVVSGKRKGKDKSKSETLTI
jgi:hypothetical protein